MSDIERERPMLAVVDNGNDADINLGLGRHAETPAVVFLSYSHDNEEHRTRVLSLSERLRRDGFDARLDRYVNGSPAQGWPRWMLDQLDDAVWVLVVCTETYYFS